MFDIPGFSPSSMSDEELLNKQMDLSRRLSYASRFSSYDMAMQLNSMIQTIEAERRDRMLKMMFVQRQNMFPSVIETDPDLAAEHRRQEEGADENDSMAQRRKIGRERVTLKKSSTPTNDAEHVLPKRDDQPKKDSE